MKYYCPVCYKEIPEEAYGNIYLGCIPMYRLARDGMVSTGLGTIKLGEKPGEFEAWFPKESFGEWFDAIRNRQKSNSIRVARCK
jgi:hypothetical protein